MTRSDAARTALLDAAERLFAEHGISGVSDRKIAEVAGQRNHSAVAYHFGGREGILAELIRRHAEAVDAERERRFEESTTLLGDVRSLVLPTASALAALPAPSWRARFLARALYHQDTFVQVRDDLDFTPATRAISRSLLERLRHLESAIARGRLSLLFRVITNSCADVETVAAHGGSAPDWNGVGLFLADSLAGMLEAPSSQSSGYPDIGLAL